MDNDYKLNAEEFQLVFCTECNVEEEPVPECEEFAIADLATYDVDQDGYLSPVEFEAVYNFYYVDGETAYHREYMFAMYDADKDHLLSLDEFKTLYCSEISDDSTVVGGCSDWAEGLHGAYDSDQDGLLDDTEFGLLQSIFTMGYDSIVELQEKYDANDDGYLSVVEY